MKPLLWSCLLAVLLPAMPAEACAHGHVGSDGLSVRLPFLRLDVGPGSIRHQPCPEVLLASAAYTPTPPPIVFAQPTYVAPAPAPVVVVQPVPVPTPAPPPVQYVYQPQAPVENVMARRRDPPREERSVARLGIKYLPGLSSTVVLSDVLAVGRPSFSHSLGLEFRLTHWLAVRSDFEMRSSSWSLDGVGLKLSAPFAVFSPYVSGSLSASGAYREPGRFSLGALAAAGFDIKIGRHFFIEGEARYRIAPGECCQAEPQVSALVGAGVAFF